MISLLRGFAIAILIVVDWAIAYHRGRQAGERRLRRRLALEEASAQAMLPPAQAGTGTWSHTRLATLSSGDCLQKLHGMRKH